MAYLSVVSTDASTGVGAVGVIHHFVVPLPHGCSVVCRLTAGHIDVLSNKGVGGGLAAALVIVGKTTLGYIGLGNAGKLIIPLLYQ